MGRKKKNRANNRKKSKSSPGAAVEVAEKPGSSSLSVADRALDTAERGTEACERGDLRAAADLFLEAMQTVGEDLWHPLRFGLFANYVTTILKASGAFHKESVADEGITSESDLELLEEFTYSKAEPALFRAFSAERTAYLYASTTSKVEMASDLAREAIIILDSVTVEEKQRSVWFKSKYTSVEELLSRIRHGANNTLEQLDCRCLYGGIKPGEGRADCLSSAEISDLCSRLSAGGSRCDACGKTLQELGIKSLSFCTRCKLVSYCCKRCQRGHWKNGHKNQCRTPSKVKPGDIMALDHHAKTRPETKAKVGYLVRVYGREDAYSDDDSTDHLWKVKYYPFLSKDEFMYVKAERLSHIRPPTKDSLMGDMPEFVVLGDVLALEAVERGDWVNGADLLLRAVRMADIWEDPRFYFFSAYTKCVLKQVEASSPGGGFESKHANDLRSFIDSETEPVLFRSKASWTETTYACRQARPELAFEFARRTIALCDLVSPEEKSHTVYVADQGLTEVEELLAGIRLNAESLLRGMLNTLQESG